jgi:hypothetical protein
MSKFQAVRKKKLKFDSAQQNKGKTRMSIPTQVATDKGLYPKQNQQKSKKQDINEGSKIFCQDQYSQPDSHRNDSNPPEFISAQTHFSSSSLQHKASTINHSAPKMMIMMSGTRTF